MAAAANFNKESIKKYIIINYTIIILNYYCMYLPKLYRHFNIVSS